MIDDDDEQTIDWVKKTREYGKQLMDDLSTEEKKIIHEAKVKVTHDRQRLAEIQGHIDVRRLVRLHNSLILTIPRRWVEELKWEKKDFVEMRYDADSASITIAMLKKTETR